MKNPTDFEGTQRRYVIPAAAIAAGLTCQTAVPAPGDLDPAFGNLGRASLQEILAGGMWSLEASVEGRYAFVGGDEAECDYYSYYGCEVGFTGGLTQTGIPDPAYATTVTTGIDVRDVARQADQKLVVVGNTRTSPISLIAYRLMPDGTRDTSFGVGGIFSRSGVGAVLARGVEIDTEGRIVIAGTEGPRLIALRLKPSGAIDETFGEAGVARGPELDSSEVDIAKAPDGGYRLVASNSAGCLVTAFTGSGALDGRFGQLGTAIVGSGSASQSRCRAIVVQPDGRVIIGGVERAGGLVARLRADGTADPTFAGDDSRSQFSKIFSLALTADGSIIAGASDKDSSPGALVARLRPDGRLDPVFGIGGRARIDLESESASVAEARVVRILGNGGVLVGGLHPPRRPFVARLLPAGAGPGVVGFSDLGTQVEEKDQLAVIRVRRTGGGAGAVSVDYRTVPGSAQPGADFTPVSGRLDWADGDSSERSITVPIVSAPSDVEAEEQFGVALSDVKGGAGIGNRATQVAIRGDGYPAGVLAIAEGPTRLVEPPYSPTFTTLVAVVRRQDYAEGSVSVTVSARPGTATPGDDFRLDPVTLTWGPGDRGDRLVYVSLLKDSKKEGDEDFSVVLSSPTGGALLGRSSATVTIADAPRSGGGSDRYSGGGGRTGLLAMLLLGCVRLFRRRHG